MHTVISREEAAGVIERFVDGGSDPCEWDDFTSNKYKDGTLERARKRCVAVADDYAPTQSGHWCSEEGINVLRAVAASLRASAA